MLFSAALDPLCRSARARRRQWGVGSALVGRVFFELYAVAHLADAALLPGMSVERDGVTGRYSVTHMAGLRLVVRAHNAAHYEEVDADQLESVSTVVVEAVRFLTEEDAAE